VPAAPKCDKKIGDIAKSTGLSVKTIRFYCDKGLLNPAGRTEGKYRLFDETSELELKLVRSLRSLDALRATPIVGMTGALPLPVAKRGKCGEGVPKAATVPQL
jgi:hypothetical protein